jgi:hypothetical protein
MTVWHACDLASWKVRRAGISMRELLTVPPGADLIDLGTSFPSRGDDEDSSPRPHAPTPAPPGKVIVGRPRRGLVVPLALVQRVCVATGGRPTPGGGDPRNRKRLARRGGPHPRAGRAGFLGGSDAVPPKWRGESEADDVAPVARGWGSWYWWFWFTDEGFRCR